MNSVINPQGNKQPRVVIVDSGRKGYSAEETAMLASLRSRSAKSVEELEAKVTKEGPDRMMQQFYLGYGSNGKPGSLPGHGSIAQSGSTSVNLENVSMLAALAFEDHPLFNGQECSTRYINFADAGYTVPVMANDKDAKKAEQIIKRWFDLYERVNEATYKHALEHFTKPEDADDKVWDKACKAYAYDVASGFLPAAANTSLTWHTQLDNANSVIQGLKYHPLSEVRNLAESCQSELKRHYPNSAKETLPDGHEAYLRKHAVNIHYSEISVSMAFASDSALALSEQAERAISWSLDREDAEQTYDSKLIITSTMEEQLMEVPKYMYLPQNLKTAGMVQLHGCLDLASFRELHRHRDGYAPVPYIDPKAGMYSWYLNSLPDSIRAITLLDLSELLGDVADLKRRNPYEIQYLCPLGIRVMVECNWQLPQMHYVMALRTGHACREPIRVFAQTIADRFSKAFPGAKHYATMEPDNGPWYERGNQDIKVKDSNGEFVSLSEEGNK